MNEPTLTGLIIAAFTLGVVLWAAWTAYRGTK